MTKKPWFWVWVQGGPIDYMPANDETDAARRFVDEVKVPWNARVYVAADTKTFEFTMREIPSDS